MMIRAPKTTRFALMLALCLPAAAQAQTQDQRFKIAIGPAATTGSGDANVAVMASIGYRFSDRFSFEVDLTGIDASGRQFSDREFDRSRGGFGSAGTGRMSASNWADLFGSSSGRQMPGGTGSRFGADFLSLAGLGSGGSSMGVGGLRAITDGQTVIGTVGFRYDLPAQGGRLRPYVGAGLGMVRTENNFEVSGNGLSQVVSAAMTRAGVPAGSGFSMGRDSVSDSMSQTGMAASAGVGASLRVFRELSVDIDARYFRLDRGRNTARFGGGLSYRF